MLQQFKIYLLVGGLPEAVNKFSEKDGIIYLPIYYCMFYERDKQFDDEELIIPEITL